ncbi:MAG TPA: hypothetical protein VKT30_07295 [Caulobacteraceae bacterium]|nr:hypothetical protein [Caulobacteraceae bacterium]
MKTRSKVAFGAGIAGALSIGIGIGFGVAWAAQPHMMNALNELRAARGELQAAIPDKGGHRVAALGLVNQAIEQVQAGIAVGAGM